MTTGERRVRTRGRSRGKQPVRRREGFAAVRYRKHTDYPFSGDQYIALGLTTRTWYDETIPVPDEDFVDGSLPKESFIVPWAISSPQKEDVETYLGRLSDEAVDTAVQTLFEYVSEE